MAINLVRVHHASPAPIRMGEACQTAFHALLTRSPLFQDALLAQIVLRVLPTPQQMAQTATQISQAVCAKLDFIRMTQLECAWPALHQVLIVAKLGTL